MRLGKKITSLIGKLGLLVLGLYSTSVLSAQLQVVTNGYPYSNDICVLDKTNGDMHCSFTFQLTQDSSSETFLNNEVWVTDTQGVTQPIDIGNYYYTTMGENAVNQFSALNQSFTNQGFRFDGQSITINFLVNPDSPLDVSGDYAVHEFYISMRNSSLISGATNEVYICIKREKQDPLLTWSTETHHVIEGDFNDSGLIDQFIQPLISGGDAAIVPLEEFFPRITNYHQVWTGAHPDIADISDWSAESYQTYVSNLSAEPGDELLLLGKKELLFIPMEDFLLPIIVGLEPDNAIISWDEHGTASLVDFDANIDLESVDIQYIDLNSDGVNEIFFQSASSSEDSYLVYGNGQVETFSNGYLGIDWSQESPYNITFTDLDNDGVLDIHLIAKSSTRANLYAYRNTAGTITEVVAEPGSLLNDPNAIIPEGVLPGRNKYSDAVGTTAGQFRVDEGGQANYSVPIYTPAGVAGVTPSVSLSYNSGGGNGLLGLGWRLNAASVINRCSQTELIDGEMQGITGTSEDRFCLNGQRLVLVSGNYGEAGSEYRTYPDGRTKVIAVGQMSDAGMTGPDYFRVWREDGSYSEFGSTASSQMRLNNGSGSVLNVVGSWSESFSEDRYGNRINYIYNESESRGESVLQRIEYGAGVRIEFDTSSKYDGINYDYNNFDYGFTATLARPQVFSGYFLGSKTTLSHRLQRIRVIDNEQEVRRYDLHYDSGNLSIRKSRLRVIQESKDDVKLQPLTFTWSEVNKSLEVDTQHRQLGYSLQEFSTNINLDGDFTPEFIKVEAINSIDADDGDPSEPSRLRIAIGRYIFDENNKVTHYSSGYAFGSFINGEDDPSYLSVSKEHFPFDLNGDGRDELIFFLTETLPERDANGDIIRDDDNPSHIENWITTHKMVALFFDENMEAEVSNVNDLTVLFETNSSLLKPEGSSSRFTSKSSSEYVFFGDIDGDQLPDFVYKEGDQLYIRYHLGTQSAPFYSEAIPTQITGVQDSNDIKLNSTVRVDFNRDGRLDLLIRHPLSGGYNWGIFLAEEDNQGNIQFAYERSMGIGSHATKPEHIKLVDINGDGLVDVVYRGASYWEYRLNTDKNVYPNISSSAISTNISRNQDVWFGDHDNDGLLEMLYVKNPGTNNATIYYREYDDDTQGFVSESQEQSTYIIGDFMSQVDFEGDGTLDIHSAEIDRGRYGTRQDFENYFSSNKTPFEVTGRIIQIDNGLGNQTSIDYQMLNDPDAENIYTEELGWQSMDGYAVRNVRGPIAVVSKAASSSPSYLDWDNTNSITYRYGTMRSHSLHGNLGFEWLETRDEQSGVVTRTTYSQTYPYIGSPLETQVLYGNFDDLESLSSSALDNRVMSQGAKSYAKKVVGTYDKGDGSQGELFITYVDRSAESGWDYNINTLARGVQMSQTISTTSVNGLGYPLESNIYHCQGNALDCDVYGGWFKRSQSDYEYLPRDEANWILARLERSSSRHFEQGHSTPIEVRTSAFEYNPVTGILEAEEIMPDSSALDEYLRKEYQYDTYGNVIRSAACSYGVNCASDPEDKLNDLHHIHRVSYTEYDSDGRYVTRTLNGYGQVTAEVIARNELGQVTEDIDLEKIKTTSVYGTFGQDYFTRTADGAWSLSTTYLCGVDVNHCPAGAQIMSESISADGAKSYTFTDSLGRTIETQVLSFDGRYVFQQSRFNLRGQAIQSSNPYFEGDTIYWTTTAFDNLNRVTAVTYPDGSKNQLFYDGFNIQEGATVLRTKNDLDQYETSYKNTFGEIIKKVDAQGNVLTYRYYSTDKLSEVKLNGVTQSIIEYDNLGRKSKMWDYDAGAQNNASWSYAYNAMDEMIEQVDPKGQKSRVYRDRLGREFRKQDLASNSQAVRDIRWEFNNAITENTSIGKLIKQYDVVNSEYVIEPQYDVLGRNYKNMTHIGAETFTSEVFYDAIGRPFRKKDASGFESTNVYNERGFLIEVRDWDNKLLRKIEKSDAFANVTQESFGNGVMTVRTYNEKTGRLVMIDTGIGNTDIQLLTYQWDTIGRLEHRIDKNQQESFVYDILNRVTHINGAEKYRYDAKGNITWKHDVGNYTYGGSCNGIQAGHHAVTQAGNQNYCYDLNGNMLNGDGRNIQYTAFNKPHYISKGGHTTELSYDPTNNRYKRIDTGSSGTTTTYYLGDVEVIKQPDGITKTRRNIAGAVIEKIGNQAATVSYLHTDHLGSTDAITNAQGYLVEDLSFDVFGQKRSGVDWSQPTSFSFNPLSITSKGYTGHEMLDEVGVIHMNGRTYDPKLGRFMQSDKYVDGTRDTQGYNRYTYVRNNPLAYTDPSGFLKGGDGFDFFVDFTGLSALGLGGDARRLFQQSWFSAAASFGCVFVGPHCSAAVSALSATANGAGLFDGIKVGARSYVTSYISQGAAGEIGGAFDAGAIGLTEAAFYHGTLSGIMSIANGGKFGHGFASGFISKYSQTWIPEIASGVHDGNIRTVLAAIVGGTVSEATGGKFASGAIQSAIQWQHNFEGFFKRLGQRIARQVKKAEQALKTLTIEDLAEFAVTSIPFGEAGLELARGNIREALISAGVEATAIAVGAVTGGVGYVAIKHGSKVVRVALKARKSRAIPESGNNFVPKGTGATSSKQGANLREHLRQTEKYGQGGVKELQNGKNRYYGNVSPANKPGEMAGRRTVREWDPATGNKRTWHETVDHNGNVRIVRPQRSDNVKNHYQFDSNGNYTGSF